LILEPICREGRLRGIGSVAEYDQCSRAAGLVPIHFQDVTRQVKRTWRVCIGRIIQRLLRDPDYQRFLIHAQSLNKIFALTLLRIWLAYELGCMHYGILTGVKPDLEESEPL
jgi:tocopherol O-methyltransferase